MLNCVGNVQQAFIRPGEFKIYAFSWVEKLFQKGRELEPRLRPIVGDALDALMSSIAPRCMTTPY